MTTSADAIVRNRKVVCSRCGAEMQPEQIWHEDNDMVPYLYWRCATGHITQAVPVPADVIEQALRQHTPSL